MKDDMKMEEMKENAKRIKRRYEERKVRLAKELEEIERQEEWSEDEIAHRMRLRNERDRNVLLHRHDAPAHREP